MHKQFLESIKNSLLLSILNAGNLSEEDKLTTMNVWYTAYMLGYTNAVNDIKSIKESDTNTHFFTKN